MRLVPPRVPRRGGFVIPVAIMVLVVLSILGIVMMFSGTSEYSQTALVYYGTKADLVARSIHEEVRAKMYDVFTAPLPFTDPDRQPVEGFARQMRTQLLTRVMAVAAGGNVQTGPLDQAYDLRSDYAMMPVSKALADEWKVDIGAADIIFYGFRRLRYLKNGFWQKDEPYYRDGTKLLDPDAKKVEAPKDYLGYYCLRVKTRCRGVVREHYYNHDMKIVSVAPVAREFVAFAYGETQDENGNLRVHEEDYIKKDLNEGGGLKLFGYRWGRIFIRGPLVMDIQGYAKGTGGYTPWSYHNGDRFFAAGTYPSYDDSKKERRHWHGWSLMPAQRAATVKNLFDGAPGRAKYASGTYAGSLINTVDTAFQTTNLYNAVFADFKNKDPVRWIVLDANGFFEADTTEWLCEAADAKETNDGFSIIGDPVDGPRHEEKFVMFRGVMGEWKAVDENDPTKGIEFKPSRPYWTDTKSWTKVEDLDSDDATNWAIHPEGLVAGRFKKVKMSVTGGLDAGIFTKEYKLKVGDEDYIAPLGLRWEHDHRAHWALALLDVMFAVLSVALLPVAAPAAMAWGSATRILVLRGVLAVAASTSLSVSFGNFGSTGSFVVPDASTSTVQRYFPPNYRPLMRGAIRKYRRLESLIPQQNAQNPMGLDGIVWCDDLNTRRAFSYRGRGMLVSEGMDETVGAEEHFSLKCPIVPYMASGGGRIDADLDAIVDPQRNANFLTIGMLRWDTANASKGKRQLVFDTDEQEFSPVAASVVAEHGVKPKDGKKIQVVGNLVSRYLNKQYIPDDSQLYVSYDSRMFPEGASVADGPSTSNATFPESEFTTADPAKLMTWYSFACSPKLAGISEGQRSPAGGTP